MDGESFDRLSVVVHRLREKATRRGALGLLFAGSVAAVAGIGANDADAKRGRRKKKKCRGLGAVCGSYRDCCSRNCFRNRCFGGGGNNGSCGGRDCLPGQDCCTISGVSICVPDSYPTCCDGGSYIPGYRCCSGSLGGACPLGQDCCGGFNHCCGPDTKCCNNRCIHESVNCDDFPFSASQGGEVDAAAVESESVSEPVTVPDEDWIAH